MKRLSILTVSLKEREGLLKNLARVLKMQSTNDVEFLAYVDNREKSIGYKRNQLLDSAKGDYIVFVDDDDMISPYYTQYILEGIKTNPDCCGIEGIITMENTPPRKFIHTVKCKKWYTENDIYYRCPNHLNPVKKEIALDTKFLEISDQEDLIYSNMLKPKLSNEVYINRPIYYYYPSKK
jgi:glycosyltransferase involved in cell wall biosynthesis